MNASVREEKIEVSKIKGDKSRHNGDPLDSSSSVLPWELYCVFSHTMTGLPFRFVSFAILRLLRDARICFDRPESASAGWLDSFSRFIHQLVVRTIFHLVLLSDSLSVCVRVRACFVALKNDGSKRTYTQRQSEEKERDRRKNAIHPSTRSFIHSSLVLFSD